MTIQLEWSVAYAPFVWTVSYGQIKMLKDKLLFASEGLDN